MDWAQVFAAFVASHALGDFLFQTDHQAIHKQRGLSGNAVARRALLSHIGTYGAAFLPVLIWVGSEQDAVWALVIALAVLVPHAVQDDGRLLIAYQEHVKKLHDPPAGLRMMIDQAAHVVALFLAALLASVG